MSGPVQFTADMIAKAMAGEQPLHIPPPAPVVQTAPVVPPSKAPVFRKLTPKNVLSLARARLREVKAELRRMKRLEKERSELERLIAAAEDMKPRLKKVAG